MAKYEYMTVTLAQTGSGLFKSREVPELQNALNRWGREGWRLREIILPSASLGD